MARLVINAVEPWISSEMNKGSRWGDEVSKRLEQTKVGIICLTAENLNEKWIHFEVGALSKTKDAYFCTLLIDIENSSDVEFPLAQFQDTKAKKEDINRLVRTINKCVGECGEKPLPENLPTDAFETYWPRLEKQLKSALLLPSVTPKVERAEGAMLQEMLQLARDQNRRLARLEHRAENPAELLSIGGAMGKSDLRKYMNGPGPEVRKVYDPDPPRSISKINSIFFARPSATANAAAQPMQRPIADIDIPSVEDEKVD